MIDLSSDTATQPSQAMRRAMAEAPVGDEQRREDPTTNRLQETAARLLGKPAALFMASSTMCNLSALRTHLRPGDEFLAEARCHIVLWEGGGYAAIAGAAPKLIATENGVFTGDQVRGAIAPDDPHFPATKLVSVENTHNDGGGTVWTPAQTADVAQAARERGLALHLDGARVMNAAVALGRPVAEVAAPFDSVTLCLSKGLGCPVGAILAGSDEFIAQARRSKKILGGAMRQSGILAAAGLYALEHGMPQLAEDHQNAQTLAHGLAEIPRVRIDLSRVQTNLIFFQVDGLSAEEAQHRLEEHGVRVSGHGTRLRAVTHQDISRDDIGQALKAARTAWA
jgi:threonine aldolase